MSLSANREANIQEGKYLYLKVEDSVHIYKGAAVASNAAGYIIPGADSATIKFEGIALEECDNTLTGHSQGGKSVKVQRRGVCDMTLTGVAQSDVNAAAYLDADDTVELTATSSQHIYMGEVIQYVSANLARIAFNCPILP